jgi:RNA polymerase sigma-70 factor (ECF subfamily)
LDLRFQGSKHNVAIRADDVDLGRDRSLVEQIQGGDLGGFEDLYRRYFQRLYRFCLRRVGNPHEAEELAQEAFARAFKAVPSLAGERRFYPWLTVIASRLCVDNHRRSWRTEPSAEIDLGSVEGGQERILDEVDYLMLGQALAQLGPRHREVLRLREEEGWSYQRIADHFEVSLGTVEALLFRARKALRREFEKVAGVDSGLAGLPILGALIRRFHSMKVRMAALNAEGLAPLMGNALAAAVVVTGVGIAGAGSHSTTVSTSPASAQIAQLPAAIPNAGSVSPVSASNVAAAVATPRVAVTPGAPSHPHVGGAEFRRGSGSAVGYSSAAPLGGKAGPLSGGLDPRAMVQDSFNATKDSLTGKVARQ